MATFSGVTASTTKPQPEGRDDLSHAQGTGWEPKGKGRLLEGAGQGKGPGRARDVVRGQDGHDDGSNMMRAPNRWLSVPMIEGLKGEAGCTWPGPPALDFPGQKPC